MTLEPRVRRARASLGALVAAHTVAQTGNRVTVLATPFFVLATGGDALDVGVAATFATVPIVLGGPLGAVLVDRVGHRLSSIVADAASAVTALAIMALSMSGQLPFWAFLLLIFAGGLLDGPGQTARTVLVATIAEEARVGLGRAVGFSSSGERTAALVGAPLGGVLVSLLGPATAFGAVGGLFVVSSLIVLLLVRAPEPTGADGDAASGGAAGAGYWADLAAGFRFVVRQPLLRLIVGMVFLTNLLDSARFSVLLPLRADDWTGGAAVVGLLSGALGGGALLGSLAFGFVGHRVRRRPLFVVAFVIAGGPLSLAFASSIPLAALIAVSAATGIAVGVLNPVIDTLRFELTPPPLRARANSLMIAGSWAGIPLGALAAGGAADSLGVTTAFVVVGAVYTVAALLPLTGGAWRRMDSPRGGPPAA